MTDYILELNGITKIFPGVKALDNVNFSLKPGEIHALMGENGAGKSTFIKVITGVNQAEEGEMFLKGEKVSFKDTTDSRKAGIAAIYQHITCYPDLTVTENIFLGHEKLKGPFKTIDWPLMAELATKLLDRLGATFSCNEKMGALSVAQQQIVEIAKALSEDAEIIIMDEPTAALTTRESEELYLLAEKLREEGKSIIFISHRFEDMYRLASRVTVLRDSQYIGTWNVDDITNHDLIMAMVGREINQLFPKEQVTIGDEVLRVEDLSRTGHFRDVSFSVKKGEIVALTGLVGSGRTEVCEAIYGATAADSGKVFLENNEYLTKGPNDSLKQGVGLLPEDRQKQGLILEFDIAKNITISNLASIHKGKWLKHEIENNVSKKLSEKLLIKARSVFDLASTLSGGNQQKIVVAKILTSDLKVVILDEPTKGVDVGAKAAIYEIMSELAKEGYAIILISSEMPEVLGMSDTVVVMKEGTVTADFPTTEASQEKILFYSMMADGTTEFEEMEERA